MKLIKNHRIRSKIKVLRVALLCVAASLVVGFARPEVHQQSVNNSTGMDLEQWVARSVSHPLNLPRGRVIAPPSSASPLKPEIHVISAKLLSRASRPASYASESIFNAVLDQVNSRHLLKSVKYSPDLARAELLGNRPVTFHGVGFPDIRTDRKPKHYFNAVDVDPTQWNPLVTWRDSKTAGGEFEPIPHVRCMGLSPHAVARRADKYEHLINEFSLRYEISPNLIKAVVTEESCFNNLALSHVGAQGLMQLMPETAIWLKVKDPADPKDNLRGGVRYLSSLLKEFETIELALAAYNAGPGNVRRYKGVPPFAETRAYLQKVQSNYRRYSAATRLAEEHNS